MPVLVSSHLLSCHLPIATPKHLNDNTIEEEHSAVEERKLISEKSLVNALLQKKSKKVNNNII